MPTIPRLKPHNLEKLRRDLLESANEYYENLIGQEADNPELLHEQVEALISQGFIEESVGNKSGAETAYNRAIAAATRLTQFDVPCANYQDDLAYSHHMLGQLYRSTGRTKEALQHCKEALVIRKVLVEQDPDNPNRQWALAHTYHQLGECFADTHRTSEAETAYKEAITIRKVLLGKHPEAPALHHVLAANQLAAW